MDRRGGLRRATHPLEELEAAEDCWRSRGREYTVRISCGRLREGRELPAIPRDSDEEGWSQRGDHLGSIRERPPTSRSPRGRSRGRKTLNRRSRSAPFHADAPPREAERLRTDRDPE